MHPAVMSRRRFLDLAARLGLGIGAAGIVLDPAGLGRLFTAAANGNALASGVLDELIRTAPIARYWTSAGSADPDCRACHPAPCFDTDAAHEHEDPRTVRCLLCAQDCVIPPGGRGRCNTRYNHGGELRTLVYGRPAAIHTDPIEKKPFYHFLPGSQAFSLATVGCALHCLFCQNWEISQARPEDNPGDFVEPARMVQGAVSRSAPVIAFTYNEPTVFIEYLVDIADLARAQGLRTAMISCGFMNEAPLRELCGCLDALKIDLKGFSPDFYRKVCSADLDPVLRSIRQAARCGVHLELVNLVVPTLNDSPAMLDQLCRWVAGEVGPDVPVHFTRFHPDYKLQHLPPTPVGTLEQAREAALAAGLHHPYVGNVPGHEGNHTYCPACGKTVIRRRGFLIETNHVRDGTCGFCGTPIAGVWS
ncbi:AmmeMemoRadiSam system radical SAM enzyme [bacterium]|nr:AmmeMemoRadiSam system radical SAM enzyme [bacterium]